MASKFLSGRYDIVTINYRPRLVVSVQKSRRILSLVPIAKLLSFTP
jgi:hypothetical protein